LLPTHTLVGVTLTQSLVFAIGIVAVTLSSDMGRMAAEPTVFAAVGSSPGACAKLALLHTAQAANERPATQLEISRSLETTVTGLSYS
jgi:hypothetical protein